MIDFSAIDAVARTKGLKLTSSGPILTWSGRSGVVRLKMNVDLLDGTASFTVKTPFSPPATTYFLTTETLVGWLHNH